MFHHSLVRNSKSLRENCQSQGIDFATKNLELQITCGPNVMPAATKRHHIEPEHNVTNAKLEDLVGQLRGIRAEMLELEKATLTSHPDLHERNLQSATNLLHYLALRRHDLRDIQVRLAAHGLSSLGRAESHVRANV